MIDLKKKYTTKNGLFAKPYYRGQNGHVIGYIEDTDGRAYAAEWMSNGELYGISDSRLAQYYGFENLALLSEKEYWYNVYYNSERHAMEVGSIWSSEDAAKEEHAPAVWTLIATYSVKLPV